MSAQEIIEEIQKLPSEEQEIVLTFLEKKCRDRQPASGVKYANDADFEKSADKVLRDHAELFRRLAQ
jgi:hypothetical protein